MATKKPERKPPAKGSKGELSPQGYEAFLGELKERIRTAQLRASLAVNREMISLYWRIGTDILARQKEHGWGAKVIDRLSEDLRREIPNVEGFSPRNLKYMRAFARAWPEEPIVQQLAAQIPWFHHCVLLDKVKSQPEREWNETFRAIQRGLDDRDAGRTTDAFELVERMRQKIRAAAKR